ISEVIAQHPNVIVSCSSEFPFFPAARRIIRYIEEARFGMILEAWSGLLHSSDLDPNKKINWKRMIEMNGEYGCMGDLGMHALHLPLRAGWKPKRVFAQLNKIVTERPDGKGNKVPCKTWDNGALHVDTVNPFDGQPFPMTYRIYRIAPGETDTWSVEILGTKSSI